MKQVYFASALLILSFSACESSAESSEQGTSEKSEASATAEDLNVVKETETVKMKAQSANAKADSILNAL